MSCYVYSEIDITVYTTEHYTLSNQQLAHHIYHLDQVEKVESNFAEKFQLGNHPEQALNIINTLRQTDNWQQQELLLKQAYDGLTKGFMQGIKKVPAIVFTEHDKNYVMYGITDVQEALTRYQQYKEEKQK
ncbi:hypothetical protein QV02_08070 [Gallibacterium anatis]|uniref:Conjugal transfer protein n=2 Tax=Gallibacterium TaxID=155493 RepID=A0A1A7Q034_9PAST|nr:hypothetical protein QV02_08070 [Gallibacterium anatis]OBW98281.1 hypothetical protein QV03_07455 [Gallibacterium anatis]OBX07396.1 hypothetical protein QV07_06980 [Gallibacterium genomosp. 3]